MLESNFVHDWYTTVLSSKAATACNGSTEFIASALLLRVCDAAIQAGGTKECLAVVSDWPLPSLW